MIGAAGVQQDLGTCFCSCLLPWCIISDFSRSAKPCSCSDNRTRGPSCGASYTQGFPGGLTEIRACPTRPKIQWQQRTVLPTPQEGSAFCKESNFTPGSYVAGRRKTLEEAHDVQ